MALFKSKAEPAVTSSGACFGSQTRFEGEVISRSDLEIAGDIKGDIKTEGRVTLDAPGRIEGCIECAQYRHAGQAKGILRTTALAAFLPGSTWEGELYPGRLDISPGAVVQGKIVPGRV
ncbi:MAG: polymer-forming cytoskeletal protein [Acidobacteriota bacterium]|jgi:cytoskeletal protein CcmA (bactofilin family)